MDCSVLFGIILLLGSTTTAQESPWKEPYFKDPENGIVIFGSVQGDYQMISMEEDKEPNVVLTYLNYKDKDIVPSITRFDEGAPDMMGPLFEYDENKQMWALLITNRIDYEILTGRKRFMVSVAVQGLVKKFLLNIINIDNKPPVVEILSYPCQIPENFVGESNCTYKLSDPDGWLQYMNFTIIGTKDEAELFEFRYNETGIVNTTNSAFVKLHTIKELDFENISIYLFDWYVEDSGTNNVTTKILVKVIDMPDMPPRWTNIFATQQFFEKTPQEFQVKAIDGDIEVNAEINYKLNSTWNALFNIDTETGVITVPEGIDRDTLKQEIFTFVVIAYEKDDPEWEANQTVSFLVDDINDNAPTIDTSNTTIWGEERTLKFVLEEEKITPLDVLIQIEDRDLGVNAMYDVSLIDEISKIYTEPFQIVPNRGYQQGNFSMAIINSSLLDYEEKEWQQFKFQIFALENLDESHHDKVWVQIELINWNDELPKFNQTEYTFEVEENVTANQFVAQVHATDRDIGDHVEYELLGTAVNNILEIGTLSGEIKTLKDDAFDYERQTQHIIQVQAQDNLNDTHHQTYAQLTLNILDINDETPTIQVPTSIRVEENRPNGHLITDQVTATDEDTTAHLKFEIEWGTSYATKNGQIVKKDFEIYIGSVYVETVNISTNPTGYARADLKIDEKVPKNTPDYEIFDTLYLNLTVTDLNQQINEGTAWVLLTINIIDLNDNPPIFVESTITKNYTVMDKALLGSPIGTITAIDPDGPPYNNVSYFIRPADEGTPKGWIDIDQMTGALTVVSDDISGDIPPKWYLNYTVHATDSELSTEADIAVYIIDVNNQKPKLKNVEEIVYIKEKSNVGTIAETKISCTDADRDAPFNVVWYRFGQPNINVAEFFRIDYITGNIVVINKNLDRDFGIQEFTVDVEYVDNYEGRPVEQLFDRTSFKIKLLDINDQIPILETKQVATKETLKKGEKIPEKILASDADEPGTDNSKIEFTIVAIDQGEEGASKDPPQDLFQIESDPQVENGVATLKTNYDLQGYYGQYTITILLNDLGTPKNEKEYSLTVDIAKHNFFAPTFVEPNPDNEKNVYYLSKTNTETTNPLIMYNNDKMPDIRADDNQGGKWDIKFSIIDAENNADEIFYIDNRNSLGRSTGRLLLQTSSFDKSKKYKFTIIASDHGDPPFTTTADVTIHFFDIDQQPHFDENDRQQTVRFSENKTGLEEVQKIRHASFNGIETQIDNLTIYYHLTPSEDAKFFDLDPIEGTITLKEELDYEEQKKHFLQIIASNSDKIPSNDVESNLELTVEVIDVNDNEPYFNTSFYGIITTDNSIDDKVLTVIAYDEDEDDYLKYSIVEGTLEKNGTNINDLTNPFEIKNELTGDIYLKFKVQQSMNGFFTFTVKAQDKPPESHTATTPVKIFIVTEKHRVEFKFESQLEVTEKKNNTIQRILEDHFGYVCNIEKIVRDAAENGEPLMNQSVVITYFINQNINEPILKEIIINKASDYDEFTKLRASFLEESMLLMGFNTNVAENNEDAALMAWLIGTTVVLGLLCLILLVAFIVKTRSLSNRLNNLSNIKFGSQESGINRIGVTAPTTNKHAIEGSNPVFGEEKQMPEIDRRSIASGDSDLIGVEDNPEFDYSPYAKDNIDVNYNNTPNGREKY